jgi:hypothetical protein
VIDEGTFEDVPVPGYINRRCYWIPFLEAVQEHGGDEEFATELWRWLRDGASNPTGDFLSWAYLLETVEAEQPRDGLTSEGWRVLRDAVNSITEIE